MRYALLLLIISFIFFMIAYVNIIQKNTYTDIQVKILPRNVYDEILLDSTLFPTKDLFEEV